MAIISTRISFTLVVALLLGWGIMSLLFIQAGNDIIGAESDPLAGQHSFPRGVKLRLDVDKRVYGPNERVLISLRNDSRQQVWLASSIDGCRTLWWAVDVLRDGDDWQRLDLAKQGCTNQPKGTDKFEEHTIRTDAWNGLVPAQAVGQVFVPAGTGTYRIRVLYMYGQAVTEADWESSAKSAVSEAFTLQ